MDEFSKDWTTRREHHFRYFRYRSRSASDQSLPGHSRVPYDSNGRKLGRPYRCRPLEHLDVAAVLTVRDLNGLHRQVSTLVIA